MDKRYFLQKSNYWKTLTVNDCNNRRIRLKKPNSITQEYRFRIQTNNKGRIKFQVRLDSNITCVIHLAGKAHDIKRAL